MKPLHLAALDRVSAELSAAYRYVQAHPGMSGAQDGDAADLAVRVAEAAAALTPGQYRPEYNGWVNRETWNTMLWIGNQEGTQYESAEIVRDCLAVIPEHWRSESTPYEPEIARAVRAGQLANAADRLRAWWTEANEDEADTAGPIADAWSYALAVADWDRIAEALAEGIE